ncbi:hypothetical protein V2E24_02485 [Mycoplasmopsis ciconiae]|uniref:Uncharacterized protein n=1 Tax=Mycoplasmopsis ciconiae TaxID=561067 RepID=A0ABU7MLM6_9BACT|nr:hypothetical protein [Mycoplasmopsis ciconiae]
MGQYFIWILFGILLCVALGFLVYSFIKEKRNKKKLLKEKQEYAAKALEVFQKSIINFNEVIKVNKIYLDNFEVSIGDYKMPSINNAARKVIEGYIIDVDFQTYIIRNDDYKKFMSHVVNLKDTKSNNWIKKCTKDIEYFNNQLKFLTLDNVEQLSLEASKEIENEFVKETGKLVR